VCCSVLQCVAVCCSVLQCVAAMCALDSRASSSQRSVPDSKHVVEVLFAVRAHVDLRARLLGRVTCMCVCVCVCVRVCKKDRVCM